mgnify:FL=1
MKKNVRNILLYIGIPLILILSFVAVSQISKTTNETKYYEIIEKIENNEISEFTLNLYSGDLTYTLRDDGKKYHYNVASPEIFYNDVNEFLRTNNKENADNKDKFIDYDYKEGGESSWLLSLLPNVLLIAVMLIFGYFFIRSMNATMGADKTMGFGKAKVRKDDGRKKTTFADVAGADEEKEEIIEEKKKTAE